MNYGPLAMAIEKLIAADRARPSKKDDPDGSQFRSNLHGAWLDIQRAQDQFFDDVKEGRIDKGE